MAYSIEVADRLRNFLKGKNIKDVQEKKMFGGLAFMVNGKMCINVSGEKLMCRFDPKLESILSERKGYEQMVMKNRQYKGYCYVQPPGFKNDDDFAYWVDVCLAYNKEAKSSKK